jgi:hypothetical protein
MIVFDKSKVALLLNPKTGTRSVIEYFLHAKNSELARFLTTGHIPSKSAHAVLGSDEYKLYSFYRCPIERFVSAYNFITVQWKLIWEDYPINPETLAKAKQEIADLKPMDILDTLARVKHGPVIELAQPQITFLQGDVELLDFSDFHNEVSKFANLVGVELGPRKFHDNKGSNKVSVGDLTEEEIGRIKEHYKVDYAFFEERGITFNR